MAKREEAPDGNEVHSTSYGGPTPSPPSETDLLAVKGAVVEFIEAFDNLEWERFRRCFVPDVTVFFPFGSIPRRANGKKEIEAGFKHYFDQVRSKAAGPPYLHLEPMEVAVHVVQDMAVVTFHLDRSHGLGRRTLILQRQDDQWRILHLHASNMEQQDCRGG